MIAVESFRMFKWKDILIITIFALFLLLFTWLGYMFLPSHYSYIISLFLMFFFATFLMFLIKKSGTVLIFFILNSVSGFWINDLGVSGWQKIIVLLVAALVFEVVYLILKLELKNIPLDITIGAILSSISIPLAMSIILSFTTAFTLLTELVNLTLVSFLLGMSGSLFSFLIWFNLRTKKIIIKLGYMQH